MTLTTAFDFEDLPIRIKLKMVFIFGLKISFFHETEILIYSRVHSFFSPKRSSNPLVIRSENEFPNYHLLLDHFSLKNRFLGQKVDEILETHFLSE